MCYPRENDIEIRLKTGVGSLIKAKTLCLIVSNEIDSSDLCLSVFSVYACVRVRETETVNEAEKGS